MNIKITKKIAEKIGLKLLTPFDVGEDAWTWKKSDSIDLTELSTEKISKLRGIIAANQHVRGTLAILKDIDAWTDATSGKDKVAQSVKQFEPFLQQHLLRVPGHRIYKKFVDGEELILAYYVSSVEFHPRVEMEGYTTPAHVTMDLIWEEFGGQHKTEITFWPEDCGYKVSEALARKGFYVETPERRATYRSDVEKFKEAVAHVGRQYFATGTANNNMDGNPRSRDNSWYWRSTSNLKMLRASGPSRVVIDVFREKDENNEDDSGDDERKEYVNHYFWPTVAEGHRRKKEDEVDADDGVIPKEDKDTAIEIPIHPMTAVFDLARHLRLRIHINYLTEYKYDRTLANKLILPAELKTLVQMLIEHKSGKFEDIIKGKSGGAVVLLAGKPGVGKTLTAEVYAESECRAMYSIQCSQLGTDPETLEDELLKIFTRAKRWNAVILLDEADVYVHERGDDLTQNAIVGVFLRVLEYQDSVMFLTTNRPEDVDDAVASRCVARLTYAYPSLQNQAKIWRVLADASKIELDNAVIKQIVVKNPELSGRDVKNLLKLASLVSESKKGKIGVDTIEFVKRFKPTGK